MSVTVLLVSMVVERPFASIPNSGYFSGPQATISTLTVVTIGEGMGFEPLGIAVRGGSSCHSPPPCPKSAGGVIAFLMLWSEFQVITLTSVLTFQVAGGQCTAYQASGCGRGMKYDSRCPSTGCLKEIITILAAVALFGDVITSMNVAGLLLVIGGSLLYKVIRGRSPNIGGVSMSPRPAS